MSFSAGVFSINSSGQPVVTGTVISSTAFNALTADLATGLSTCVLKDGTQTLTANIPFAGFKATGLGAGSSAGHSLRYEQLFSTSPVALLGAMDWFKGADIASATTTNLTTATGNAVHVTGTTTITAITLGTGMWRLVIFDGILTLTHHATNNNLPGGANITTATGDRALYWSDGTTVYCVEFIKASGNPVLISGFAAAQSDQETSTSLTQFVSPGRQQFHPSAAKGWCKTSFSGSASASYNVSSVTDSGTGNETVNWGTDFSTSNYAVVGMIEKDPAGNTLTTFVCQASNTGIAAGSTSLFCLRISDGTAQDTDNIHVIAFGDQ